MHAVGQGVDVGAVDLFGNTALHKAVALGDANLDTTILLLNAAKGM